MVAILVFYSITIISAAYIIITENRNPVKSLAWITVLCFLPVIGLVSYLFFGRSFKNKRLITRAMKRKLLKRERIRQVDFTKLTHSEESIQLIRLGHKLTGSIYFPGNEIEIFTEGKSKFDALKTIWNVPSAASISNTIFSKRTTSAGKSAKS